MSKSKLILAGIFVAAGIAAALAFKAKSRSGIIFITGQRFGITTEANCTTGGTGCLYEIDESLYQIYTTVFGSNVLLPLKTTL